MAKERAKDWEGVEKEGMEMGGGASGGRPVAAAAWVVAALTVLRM